MTSMIGTCWVGSIGEKCANRVAKACWTQPHPKLRRDLMIQEALVVAGEAQKPELECVQIVV